jgi:hypothetical protein
MTLLSISFRPLRGALRSSLKPITSAGEYSSIRNRPTEASISSTGYNDAYNTPRFLSLVGVGGIRCLNSSAANEIDDLPPCSDATDKYDHETVEDSRRKARWDRMWNRRYEELKEYVAENGDSLVPWKYAKNESLGVWVKRQRSHFNAEVALPNERTKKLDEIGFIWDVLEAQWFERLQELKEYKKNHGDTLVPRGNRENPLLGRWVNTQRSDYTHYQKIKELEEKWRGVEVLDDKVKEEMDRLTRRGMTEKRIQLLEAEDFVWDVHAHAWELRFQELRDLVALDGRAVFIQRQKGGNHDRYDPLAEWASMQREKYMKRQNGLHTTLTEDRIEKLNSIGFAWELPKKRVRRISMKRQHFI